MSVQPRARMNVDEFLVWAEDRPGRHELCDGEVVSMSPQRALHARTKFRVQTCLDRAIRNAGLSCEMLPDGMAVRIDTETACEPDALVQCGEPGADDAVAAAGPIIVVEVLSPATKHIDSSQKLDGYFRLPRVMHYLVVDPKRQVAIHHRRSSQALIETRIVSAGSLSLDPPGLTIPVADLFRS